MNRTVIGSKLEVVEEEFHKVLQPAAQSLEAMCSPPRAARPCMCCMWKRCGPSCCICLIE